MNLLRVLATVSSLTMVSRVLGYVRDFLIARIFGAGLLTDAFFVAFKIPNLLRRLFAEGAFSQAFVPILAEYKNRSGAEDTKTLIDAIATVLDINGDETAPTTLPFFYSYGMSVINSHLRRGARVLVTDAGLISREREA